jgi:predicted  nucleic acid-binding Zn-ribbon protein
LHWERNKTMDNIIVLTENENTLQKVTKEVDEKAGNLGVEAALADKYASLTSETPYYEGFKAILLNLPNELRRTSEFWRNTAKNDLQRSLASIRSFCATYTNYFPDVIEEIFNGAKSVTAKKEGMLEYLGEMRPRLDKSISHLKITQDTSKQFLTQVENHKDKLESTVLPNIKKTITEKKTEIEKNDADLKECRTKINQIDKKRMAVISAAVATGSGLVVSGAAVGVTATALYFKSTGRIIGSAAEGSAISYGRFGGAITGKIAVGVSVAFVVANIIGFVTSSALWYQYQKELAELREKELNYFQTSIDLNADAGYLNNMEKNFTEILQQGSEVVTAFQGLQEKWKNVRLEIDKVDSKLKDLGTSLTDKPAVNKVEQNLSELNDGFVALEKKLKSYELDFALPAKFIEDPKTITSDNTTLLRSSATQWIPSSLYSAYTARA